MKEKSLNAQITLFLFIMSAPCLALLVLVGTGFAPSWPFVHDLDPVLLSVGGLKTYYYGLAYALGFLGMHLWLRFRRRKLGWTIEEVYDFSILFSLFVLVFGRAFEIVVYEWDYYREHLGQLLSYWKGGMASHGVLLGAILGIWLFSRLRGKRFLQVADEVAIPAALFLALGRIGNFVNGQIYGSVTSVWWAVQFPDAEGFRHPVALYESLKNFAIIPILLIVRRFAATGRGGLTAHFVFWYGFLRLFTDYFREYGTEFLGIGTGQYFNIFMSVCGLGLMILLPKRKQETANVKSNSKRKSFSIPEKNRERAIWQGRGVEMILRKAAFAFFLVFSLHIPCAWTQGVLTEIRDRNEVASEKPIKKETVSSSAEFPNRGTGERSTRPGRVEERSREGE